jgi:hypothetical protein
MERLDDVPLGDDTDIAGQRCGRRCRHPDRLQLTDDVQGPAVPTDRARPIEFR